MAFKGNDHEVYEHGYEWLKIMNELDNRSRRQQAQHAGFKTRWETESSNVAILREQTVLLRQRATIDTSKSINILSLLREDRDVSICSIKTAYRMPACLHRTSQVSLTFRPVRRYTERITQDQLASRRQLTVNLRAQGATCMMPHSGTEPHS